MTMNYKITRTASENNIFHSEKDSKERDNHKYVARVLIKKKSNKNIYRYFYDKKEYQQYLKYKKEKENTGKEKFEKHKKSVTNFFDKIKKSNERNVKESFDKIDSIIEKGKKYAKSIVKKEGSKKVSEMNSSKIKVDIKGMLSFLAGGLIGWGINELLNKSSKNKEKEKESKYVAKVKLPNGKEKYFYSQDEYDAYKKRLDYQKNEPDFMKHVKDISENDVFTALEDMDKINETYNPYSDSRSMNCGNCSVAYELRRRGYDVEAKEYTQSDYNGLPSRFYDYFENAEIIAIRGDGNTFATEEKTIKKLCDSGLSIFDRNKKEYDFYSKPQSYTPETIEKAITNNNPPGSRGMIDVNWNLGGGHSLVYEVDSKGKVIIRDSQSYDEYSIDEIAKAVQRVTFTRTDNLELKEGILDAVKTNEDNKRKYYVDKGKLYSTLN